MRRVTFWFHKPRVTQGQVWRDVVRPEVLGCFSLLSHPVGAPVFSAMSPTRFLLDRAERGRNIFEGLLLGIDAEQQLG